LEADVGHVIFNAGCILIAMEANLKNPLKICRCSYEEIQTQWGCANSPKSIFLDLNYPSTPRTLPQPMAKVITRCTSLTTGSYDALSLKAMSHFPFKAKNKTNGG